MKISNGGATIWVSPRRIGGAEIIQGKSRIKLRADEVAELGEMLTQLSSDAHEGKRMMTDIETTLD